MKNKISPKQPKYLAIYKELRENIINGLYKSGGRMPSKRTVADRFGVSVVTAEHAYALLAAEGYVESRERSGFFCAYTKGDRFLSAVPVSRSFTPEAGKDPGAFSFSLYAKTVRRVLSLYGEAVLSRCPGTGTDILKNEISAYLMRSRAINAPPDRIIIGAGAEYLYGMIVELLGSDKIYAAEDPSYEKIEQVYKAKGVSYEMLPLSQSGIKSAALKKTGADVLHITPYRSFPSGVTASASKRREYIDWSKRENRYIIEDDFESEFTLTGKIYDTVYSLSPLCNVIYMNTFSRTVSPAVRTAFMVLPEKLMQRFTEKLGFYSCTVPSLDQYVLAEMLKSGEFERHVNRRRRELKKQQIILSEDKNICTD